MIDQQFLVPIRRNGNPIPASPVTGRLHYATSFTGQRHEIIPQVSKVLSPFSFCTSGGVDLRIGDMLDIRETPFALEIECPFAKIVNPKHYRLSTQCDLERVPYEHLPHFVAASIASNTDPSTLNVTDENYDSVIGWPTMLAYIDPWQDLQLNIESGRYDISTAHAYSLLPMANGDCLKNSDGSFWVAEANSLYYSATKDYVTLMRRSTWPPAGVL